MTDRSTAFHKATGLALLLVVSPLAADEGVRFLEPPATAEASHLSLAAEPSRLLTDQYEIVLGWVEGAAAGGQRLRFSRATKEVWTPPLTLAEPIHAGPVTEPTNFVVIDTQAVRRTLLVQAGDVVVRSGDGGRDWSRLTGPSLSFASFASGEEGAYAFWLRAGADGTATLLGTRVLAGETVLDPRVATGRATASAMTWDGPVVVYRDLAEDGSTPLAIVRREQGEWVPPRVFGDAVAFAGGAPRLAVERRQVAVAWAGRRGTGIHVSFSSDAGRTFSPPVALTGPERDPVTTNAFDLLLDDDGQALLLWAGAEGHGAPRLRLARLAPDGRRGASLDLGPVVATGEAPRLARAGSLVAAAWLASSAPRVRVATVTLAGIPAVGSVAPAVVEKPVPKPTVSPAPGVEVVSLAGAKASFADFSGRPVLVNFWATWCLPCLGEMPELAALHERFGKDGLAVVGVNIDSPELLDRVRAMVAERKLPFTIWLDPAGRLVRPLKVEVLPTTVVFDRHGQLVWRRDRAITAADPELLATLQRALAK